MISLAKTLSSELLSRGVRVTVVSPGPVTTSLLSRLGLPAEKLSEVATEFDRVHSIQRAVEVGSVDAVIGAHELRPRLIAAVSRR